MNADALITDAAETAATTIAERLEYKLRGAWRAGYDYVHVYGELPIFESGDPPADRYSIRRYTLASNQRQPPRPHSRDYRYTYDLTSVSDAEIQAAIRHD